MFDPILILIGVVFMVIGLAVSFKLKGKFKRYSQEPLSSGLSGKEVAEKMLRDNGIYDVKVVSTSGMLSDHYNPANKTVNLSKDVYQGSHIAAAAVAAHECGHAVQHADSYSWLSFRTAVVPLVNVSATIMNVLIFAFIFGASFAPHLGNTFLLVYIICQAVITLFSIVTLPVEVDASKRALQWLNASRITSGTEHAHAKDALTWAAYTYFVSALASITTLLYLVLSFLGARED